MRREGRREAERKEEGKDELTCEFVLIQKAPIEKYYLGAWRRLG